jgi:hypothetical protein
VRHGYAFPSSSKNKIRAVPPVRPLAWSDLGHSPNQGQSPKYREGFDGGA